MHGFPLLFLAVAGLVLALPVAERLTVPYPLLLTFVGIGVALVPGFPEVSVDPDLILPLLLPPLLYAAAQRTSLTHLRAHLRPILGLAVALVAVSAAAAGWLLTVLLPGLPFAVALAVGAAVAPPDPVAATAVAPRIGLPHRMVTVIEGEGLVNDATALTLFRIALSAYAAGGSVGWLHAGGEFVWGAVGALAVGVAVAWPARLVLHRLGDPVVQGAFTVALPYAAYLAAEALRASGVLAVLVAGLALTRARYQVFDAAARLTGRAFWSIVDLLLTAVAFVLVGLELRPVLRGAYTDGGGPGLARQLLVAAAVCGLLVLIRMVWLTVAGALGRHRDGREPPVPATWRDGLVMGWAGMRGVVTVAVLLGLPADVPQRSTLVLVGFATVVVTLLVPGVTLPWLSRALGVADTNADAAVREVTDQVLAAMATRVREMRGAGEVDEATADRLERRFGELRESVAAERKADEAVVHGVHRRRDVMAEVLSAAQEEALRLRTDSDVDPAAVDRVLRRIDAALLDST